MISNRKSFFKKCFSFVAIIIFLCGVIFSNNIVSAKRKKTKSKARRSGNSSRNRFSKSKGKARRSAGSSKRRSGTNSKSTVKRARNITNKIDKIKPQQTTVDTLPPKDEEAVENGDKILCPIGKLLKKNEEEDEGIYHFNLKETCIAPDDIKENYLKGSEQDIKNKLTELGSPSIPTWISKENAVYLTCTDDYTLSGDYNNNHILKKKLKKDFKNNPPCISIYNFCPINEVVTKKKGQYFADDLEGTDACFKVRNSVLDPLSKEAIEKLYSEQGKEFKYGRAFKMQCESGFIPEKYKSSDAVVSCKSCPPYYKPDDSGLKCVPGIPCDAGKYFNDITGQCDACSPGTYNPDKNKVGASACKPAPAGYYINSPAACDKIKCPKGKYCPGEKTIEPEICPTGTYNDTEGATDESACIKCPKDKEKSSPGSTSIDNCIPNITVNDCTAGTYFNGKSCDKCPAGQASSPKSKSCSYCKGGQYVSNGECKSCEPGYYCPDGKVKEICPYNTHTSPEGGATECKECSAAVWFGSEINYIKKYFGKWSSYYVEPDNMAGVHFCDVEEFTKGMLSTGENSSLDYATQYGMFEKLRSDVSTFVQMLTLGASNVYCTNGVKGYPSDAFNPELSFSGEMIPKHSVQYGNAFTMECDSKDGTIYLKDMKISRLLYRLRNHIHYNNRINSYNGTSHSRHLTPPPPTFR